MQNQNDCGGERQNTANGQEEALDAALRQTEKKESSRRHKTRRYFGEANNWIAVLTFVVLVAYTLVTGALWFAQLKANAINAATYEASNRPWLMINKITPTGFSSDNNAGLDFSAYFAMKNTGHSPAQNVSITAELMVGDNGMRPDIGMDSVCKKGQTGDWVIPGRPIFPDQSENVQGDTPNSFTTFSAQVWATRKARIDGIYANRMASEGSKEHAQAWADALAKFPFYAQVYLVGCVNYRSPDNRSLYQTSFMFGIESKDPAKPLALLSEDNPIDLPPTPMPGDPDGVVVHPRALQRIVPGSRIKLTIPLSGTFAS